MPGSTTAAKAERFRALHQDPELLVLPNAWDVMTARAFEDCGFGAIATTSFGVDRAHGLLDGANAGFETSLAMVRRMAAALTVPLSVDFEAGYADTPQAVAANARALVEAGAVGFNLEDGHDDPARLCAKLRALTQLATAMSVPFFVNARVDVFWLRLGDPRTRLDRALERAAAYRAAGADGILHPAAVASPPASARAVAALLDAPLNLLRDCPDLPPLAELARLGVRRRSTGCGYARATAAAAARLRRIGDEPRTSGMDDDLDEDAPS